MQSLEALLNRFLSHTREVLLTPFDSSDRVYLLYLITSMLIAFLIYRRVRRSENVEGTDSFLQFLFPKKVWSHPSAWLDLRYFFFHKLIGHFLLLGLAGATGAVVFKWVTGGHSVLAVANNSPLEGWVGFLIASGFMFVAMIAGDFVNYYVHYLQHKVPILWQFHKVHHSAEVMHPLSNYREHPVDNLLYLLANGAIYGMVAGIGFNILGYTPSMPSLLGVPFMMFLFNLVGYNLRHSHIWLRWPGVWSKVFPSPAHHHVHHSCHPDHLDKNFAFMFPLWDVVFGTYEMPEDNRDVKFGVTEKDRGHELDTCWKLYSVPVKDAWRILTNKPQDETASPEEEKIHPAE